MATLYLVNPTKHNQIIVYRLPESTSVVRRQLVPGQQIDLKDLSVMDVESIIKQNTVYGWVDASTIDRNKPYVSIIYSVDKQVTPNKIMAGVEHNQDVLLARGKTNRELAAVATNEAIERSLEGNNLADLNRMSMTIEEEDRKDRSAEISEHITVDRHAEGPRNETRRPQNARQAAISGKRK